MLSGLLITDAENSKANFWNQDKVVFLDRLSSEVQKICTQPIFLPN